MAVETIDLDKMRAACKAAAETLALAGRSIRPGMTTADIDRIVHNDTVKRGGRPAPLNYRGFPKSCCTSVNAVVCHGIPSKDVVLKEGDIVNVDVTTILDGHFGDTNATFLVGECSPEARLLVYNARLVMDAGIEVVRPGAMLGEVGAACQWSAEKHGLSVVREFGGHGIGRIFHAPPHVSHYGSYALGGFEGPELLPGMTFTIEPMVNVGKRDVYIEDDGWTVRTQDGSLSAQWEHTVLVTENGVEVLTRIDA